MGNLSAKKVAGISIMLGPIIGCVGYFLNNIVALEGNDPSSAAVVPLINQNAGLTFVTGILIMICLLYTSPSPRDGLLSRMPSSA